MSKQKLLLGSALCILTILLISSSFSAAGGAGGRGARGGAQRQGAARQDRNPEQMRARMQEMMDQRMKQQLGITTDEEWNNLKPQLQKVQDLNRQVSVTGTMGILGRRGFGAAAGRGPGGARGPAGTQAERTGTAQRELNAVEKAAGQLQDILAGESPDTDDINAKLTAYRTARDKVKQDLAKAQEELKKIVTLKQEASLVLMGLLN